MPKKRQDRLLLIKPGSSSKSTSSSLPQHNAKSSASVNELIQESRRLQPRIEPYTTPITTGSVPPSLREVLSLPIPPSPAPRTGFRSAGPTRLRRIPGPPPPQSWLTDSVHASKDIKDCESQYQVKRLHRSTSDLPGTKFPKAQSLRHVILKTLAVDWDWHAECDHTYLSELHVSLRELLMSYIAIYCDRITMNPLRLLFLTENDTTARESVTRLDLSGGVGHWTSIKQIEKDMFPTQADGTKAERADSSALVSWEDIQEIEEYSNLSNSMNISTFQNLKHLSLALTPGGTALWKDLVRITSKLSTLNSLSLAYWPRPTYTPRASSTRAVVQTSAGPSVLYGGSNFYSTFDNDWREAAGILRSLSRSLYCLRWLDLTGCGEWFPALTWNIDNTENLGPEWSGGWRGVEQICLDVGWTPLMPEMKPSKGHSDENETWDVETERQQYWYRKDVERVNSIRNTAISIAKELRNSRKRHGGKWIEVDFGTSEWNEV